MIKRLEMNYPRKNTETFELGKTIGLSKQNVSQLEIKLENLTSQLKEANNRAESLEMQLDSTTNQLQQIQKSMLAAKNNNGLDPKLGEELRDTMKRNETVSKLDGLIVRLEGFLTYDDVQSEINLSTRNGVKKNTNPTR